MLLAEVRPRPDTSSGSSKAAFTSRWQSSKAPSTARASTLPPQVANWRSCRGETRPLGYITTTCTPGRPQKAWATAAPVSPEVAVSTVRRVPVAE